MPRVELSFSNWPIKMACVSTLSTVCHKNADFFPDYVAFS